MKLLVCGGRNYTDKDLVYKTLDEIHTQNPDMEICHGGATGADALAEMWAIERGIQSTVFNADWSLGRAAGPIRNKRMLDEFKPDKVIAFSGGPGTANMIKLAQKANIPTLCQNDS